MSTHRDFERHPAARWRSGGLKELIAVLDREASRAGGEWVKRVLRQGAWVGMRHGPNGRELRICRRDRPIDDPDGAKWRREVAIFLRDFGCQGWEEITSPEDWAGPIITLLEAETLL
jgi:hypothetical protein